VSAGFPLRPTQVASALVRRPALWPTAARQLARMARRGWWRRPPFLPVPDPEYLRFRLVTMYGGAGDGPMDVDDLVAWLEWCRRWPAASA
jgi:hypothetical protein